MSTIHNPTNFVPEDYTIVDYIDNRGPNPLEYLFAAPGALEQARKEFMALVNRYFTKVPHRCVHCGHAIRYVVVCDHPHGHVAIGTDCADRIDMSVDEFKIRCLKEVAAKRNATIAAGGRYNACRNGHPETFKIFEANAVLTDYDRDTFIHSVFMTVRRQCTLSAPQIEAVVKAWERRKQWNATREEQRQSDPDQHDVIPGRSEITGRVISTKISENDWGVRYMMLVLDDRGFKIYGTCPNGLDFDSIKGKRIVMNATVEESQDDPAFGFFKRPAKAEVTE